MQITLKERERERENTWINGEHLFGGGTDIFILLHLSCLLYFVMFITDFTRISYTLYLPYFCTEKRFSLTRGNIYLLKSVASPFIFNRSIIHSTSSRSSTCTIVRITWSRRFAMTPPPRSGVLIDYWSLNVRRRMCMHLPCTTRAR